MKFVPGLVRQVLRSTTPVRSLAAAKAFRSSETPPATQHHQFGIPASGSPHHLREPLHDRGRGRHAKIRIP